MCMSDNIAKNNKRSCFSRSLSFTCVVLDGDWTLLCPILQTVPKRLWSTASKWRRNRVVVLWLRGPTRQQSISVITARFSPECRFGVFGTHISRKSRNKKLHLRKSYSNTWPFIPSFINPAVELPNHRRRLGSTMLAETRF